MVPLTGVVFFFNDTATTEIYTLSLHDALPIFRHAEPDNAQAVHRILSGPRATAGTMQLPIQSVEDVRKRFFSETREDRKSTRLNSSHANISYAVFCLKKKKRLRHSPSLV